MNSIIIQRFISAISKQFSVTRHAHQIYFPPSQIIQNRKVQKNLRVLDITTPKNTKTQASENHLNLIQACMQDLVVSSNANPIFSNSTPNVFVDMLDRDVSWNSFFFQIHKEGMITNESTLSCALSSCGSIPSLKYGLQLHCIAIKTGLYLHVYVGSSLINLYGKCGMLKSAYRMFGEMPDRNVVTWTSIMASFSQHGEVEMCLELYNDMRLSTMRPNDFTFTTILSACTSGGFLEQGRNAHCQTIQMGFDSFTHIVNVLISMYSKCGNLIDALYIFMNTQRRDLISWNSMIAGYAQYGLAREAINLLDEMRKWKIRPDAITFLGVLSSCRHAGLVEHGLLCLNSMVKHGVELEMDHYSCIVDLLGRAGRLEEARKFIEKMPISAHAVIWGSLLSSCRLCGNVLIGIQAAENKLILDPSCAATHVQLVNLYARAGHWDQVARVRKAMKDRGLKTSPGYSWIEIGNEVYRFRVSDGSNSKASEILAVVDCLLENMSGHGYATDI